MKKLGLAVFAFAFCVLATGAQAQQNQCRTAPVGTSTATCSSEAFVTQSIASLGANFKAVLGGDVALTDVTLFFPVLSLAQGTSGTWRAIGKVSVTDTAGSAAMNCKLWDGATVFDSSDITTAGAGSVLQMTLQAIIASPAGNIVMACRDQSSTSGKVLWSASGLGMDSSLSAEKIQ